MHAGVSTARVHLQMQTCCGESRAGREAAREPHGVGNHAKTLGRATHGKALGRSGCGEALYLDFSVGDGGQVLGITGDGDGPDTAPLRAAVKYGVHRDAAEQDKGPH